MKFNVSFFMIVTLVVGLVATVPVGPVLALCPDGTPADDIIDCATDADLGGGTDVSGLEGNDDITLGSGVTSGPNVVGDGYNDEAVTGGDDTLTIEGTAAYVAGDAIGGTTGTGGNDDIEITGTANDVQGDGIGTDVSDPNTVATGGNDTLHITGDVDHVDGDGISGYEINGGDDEIGVDQALAVCGDGGEGNYAYGGDDYLEVGYVDQGVGGDCMNGTTVNEGGDDTLIVGSAQDVQGDGGQGGTLLGGDDAITIYGETGFVAGEGGQAEVSAYGGDDDIVINGSVKNAVGDGIGILGTYAEGGDDSLVINGTAGQVAGDGIDIPQDESGLAFVPCATVGCDVLIVGGDDEIVVNGYAEDVTGDSLWTPLEAGATVEGGNDVITIVGEAAYVAGDGLSGQTATGGDDLIIASNVEFDVSGDGIWEAGLAEGGDDQIVATDVRYVHGDGIGNSELVLGGNDIVVTDGTGEYVGGDAIWDSGSGYGGADTLTINGSTLYVEGDGIGGELGTDFAVGGDDTLLINGEVIFVGGDGLFVNESAQGGNDTITVNGEAIYVAGDGLWLNTQSGPTLTVEECGLNCVNWQGGDDTITINGLVWGDVAGDDVPAFGYGGDDTIIVNGDVNGNVFGDGFNTLEAAVAEATTQASQAIVRGGDDTVVLGAGGVSYAKVCGDISVTTVVNRPATVGGIIDGESGDDTLVFSILTPNEDAVANLDAYIASLSGTDSGTVNGVNYNWANFEYYSINATVYSEGPARLYDDGVTLGFASAGGVIVCNGPSGLRAASIDFAQAENGQLEFGANGFVVKLTPLGSGQYEVHVFLSGVEQINDADSDGVADDLFVFGF